MAARSVFSIPVPGVPTVRVLQGQRQTIRLMRDYHKVNMIGHQTVSKERHLVLLHVFLQQPQIDGPIFIALQYVPSPVPTLRYVMRLPDS